MKASGDKTRKMSHVDHEISANAVGNATEGFKVPDTRIARAAGNNNLGLMFFRQTLHLLHINTVIVLTNGVSHRLEPAS